MSTGKTLSHDCERIGRDQPTEMGEWGVSERTPMVDGFRYPLATRHPQVTTPGNRQPDGSRRGGLRETTILWLSLFDTYSGYGSKGIESVTPPKETRSQKVQSTWLVPCGRTSEGFWHPVDLACPVWQDK